MPWYTHAVRGQFYVAALPCDKCVETSTNDKLRFHSRKRTNMAMNSPTKEAYMELKKLAKESLEHLAMVFLKLWEMDKVQEERGQCSTVL